MSHVKANWHDHVFFGIHYDLHANENDTELGRELTHEHLEERLSRVKPDWIQCDCKGHRGYTSWPTKVGSTSPGVVKDALEVHRDVTRKLGIRLGMHYSGVWDSRAIELHPEWACIDAAGKPSPNMTCRLSAYDDELMIPQMIELVRKYDVDGFWVDGENWAAQPCWCPRCKEEFTRRTGIKAIPTEAEDEHWEEWLAFHRDLFNEHVTSYADAVHAVKADCLICSNWMYTVRQPGPVTASVDYLSGDYDWVWGANRAAVEGRVLDGRGLSWDLMAWGFIKSGEMSDATPWVVKEATHLCQELVEVVALGGAVMIYNQPQRSGWLTGWHQDRFAEAAQFCRARKEACFQSSTVPQALILHLADHYYACNSPLFNYGEAIEPIEGALHALLETHRSTDILTEADALERMGQYRLAVVPEQTRLSEAVCGALEAFAAAGGHVIVSGPHLAEECPALVGARPAGEPVSAPGPRPATYLQVGEQAVGVSGRWQAVVPEAGTEALAYRLTQQEPAKDATGEVIITRRRVGAGSIVGIHGPIFRNYFQGHYPLLRRFIGELVEGLGVQWQVEVDGPARLEVILREKAGKLVVNLINRGAAEMLMPRRVVNEELVPVENITLTVRRDSRPQEVTAVPDGEPEWSYSAGLLQVRVPLVEIHTAIVIG